MLMVILPVRPTKLARAGIRHDGDGCCGAPLVRVPLCWSTKLPVRPWSVPVIRSMAT